MSKSGQAVNPRREKNITSIHEMMYSVAKKYSDVSIHVGDKVFKSNRWALAGFSEYFDTQFERWASNQEDEDHQTFTLHVVDADTFEKILAFMFSGEIKILDSNVYALLRAADYLLLRNNLIQEECISYLKIAAQKPQPILDAFKIAELSHTRKNQLLMNLLSTHILKLIDLYLREPAFKEISFDCMNAILKCRGDFHIKNDYILLQAINTWVDHSRVKRKEHRKELMKNLNPVTVSTSDFLSLMDHYENFIDSMTSEQGASGIKTASDLHLVYPASSPISSKTNGCKRSRQEILHCDSCLLQCDNDPPCDRCNRHFCLNCLYRHQKNVHGYESDSDSSDDY